MKKKGIYILALILIMFIMLALGSSYALFRFNITNNTNFKVISGTLSLVINDSETDRIVKNGMIPETDKQRLSSNVVNVNIENNATHVKTTYKLIPFSQLCLIKEFYKRPYKKVSNCVKFGTFFNFFSFFWVILKKT